MTPTTLQALASLKLGQDIHEWVAAHRSAGQSWRRMAATLADCGVTVSWETLRAWDAASSEQVAS